MNRSDLMKCETNADCQRFVPLFARRLRPSMSAKQAAPVRITVQPAQSVNEASSAEERIALSLSLRETIIKKKKNQIANNGKSGVDQDILADQSTHSRGHDASATVASEPPASLLPSSVKKSGASFATTTHHSSTTATKTTSALPQSKSKDRHVA